MSAAGNGHRARRSRVLSAGALGGIVLLTGAGCAWDGLNSLPLPGAQGNGDGAYEVTIEMPNVTTITRNSPVRVNDVNVGSISAMRVEDYTAIVTVTLNEEVRLPANAHAKIGQTSLLGSQHLELFPPPDGKQFLPVPQQHIGRQNQGCDGGAVQHQHQRRGRGPAHHDGGGGHAHRSQKRQ